MPDLYQFGDITTLHDLHTGSTEQLEQQLREVCRNYPIGLVLPVTAADMRAEPFRRIMQELKNVDYIERIVVVLGVAPDVSDYKEAAQLVGQLEGRASLLWTDGSRVQALYKKLTEEGLNLSLPGKGRSVWTAFGYLLADQRLKAFVLHDCDIVNYNRGMLARLCLPMAHPSLDFEFCKAYYARVTNRLHGRVVRLLVSPLLQALITILGPQPFLRYLASFRYPLSGEFAVTSTLARSNRIPADWGLEVGTLAEVFRNTSIKRVCQVELCEKYEHKHQPFSFDDPTKGLMKMARDILTTIFRSLASMGFVLQEEQFVTLRCAYLRQAQDAIRKYYADSLMNGLDYDRHEEEQAVEAFAQQIVEASEIFRRDPAGGQAIPNWSRVLAAFPRFPEQLREVVEADAKEFA